MSHYGTPPPDGSDEQPEQPEPPTPPGSHAAEPAAYNPYPDNWNAPPSNEGAFVAKAADEPSYQPGSYAAQPVARGLNPYAGNPRPDKPTFGFGGYAGWFTRVGAYLIDAILASVAAAPAWVGQVMRFHNFHFVHNPDGTVTTQTSGTPAAAWALILVGTVTGLVFLVWNVGIRQGRTGASVGKSVLAVRLVNSDLQPIGTGSAILRQLLHILDGLPCICLPLGYLWPLWDERKQTFADKIVKSFVIQATTPQPPPY